MSLARVAVTGGNGKIGEEILAHLNDHGYHTINMARGKQREEHSDQYMTVDMLDEGEIVGALSRTDADAIIHMGTIPGPTKHPGHVTYESNVMSTANVLEAAEALELESVCLASSINAMGSVHQQPPADVRYFPIDEEHPCLPHDPYGISKHAIEVTADGYGRRQGKPTTISSLRYPWVGKPEEIKKMFVEKDRGLEALDDAWHHTTRNAFFCYLHIEDAASAARLAIEADFEGHEAFWTVAADTASEAPNDELIQKYFPDAEVSEELGEFESLVECQKAQHLLGWEPAHSWRDL